MKYFFLFITLCAIATPPVLKIHNQGTNIVVYVDGGETNKQYWVLTSNENSLSSTNWYEWRRFYPGISNAVPVFDPTYSTNMAAGKPQRFFKLGLELP